MPVHGSFYHWAANNKPIMSSVTTGIHQEFTWFSLLAGRRFCTLLKCSFPGFKSLYSQGKYLPFRSALLQVGETALLALEEQQGPCLLPASTSRSQSSSHCCLPSHPPWGRMREHRYLCAIHQQLRKLPVARGLTHHNALTASRRLRMSPCSVSTTHKAPAPLI